MPRASDVIVSSQRTASLDLSVARRGGLRGVVIDLSNDALLEGVEVRLWDAQGSPVGSVHTDGEGAFHFAGLRPGTYRAEAILPRGYAAVSEPSACQVSAGEDANVEIELTLAGRVAGRVVDEDTGQPVVGVRVRLFDSSERLVAEADTGADGSYAFLGLPEDKYRVETS